MKQIDLKPLYKKLGYSFNKTNLIKQALTHCSVGPKNNERLEFLGDSILNFIIAEKLFSKYPNYSEGELSRLRSFLVKGETLAVIANEIDLGNYLFLGQGELKSGGFRRASILANALEAVFAAIYLDSNLIEIEKVIINLYAEKLIEPDIAKILKDPKTFLQEFLQAKHFSLPVYQLVDITGEDHNQIFTISCKVSELDQFGTGSGTSRRKAEQKAAQDLLDKVTKK